jgi:hypothetical protein
VPTALIVAIVVLAVIGVLVVAMRDATRAAVVLVLATAVIGTAAGTRTREFVAVYTGHGTGQVSGTSASGQATAVGSASFIGKGTLAGSAIGTFTSQTCVVFSGSATLSGSSGTLRLAAHNANACASGDASSVSFSGSAAIKGGTGTLAGAHGTLSFTGTYTAQTGGVTITFRGRIS